MAKINLPVIFAVIGLLLFCGCAGEQKGVKATTTPTLEEVTLPEITSTTYEAQENKETAATPLPPGWTMLKGVSGDGFMAEYAGYAFRIDHFVYSSDYSTAGIMLDVRKPDGSVVQVQASEMADGFVDNLEIKFPPEYARDDGKTQTAAIYVLQEPAEKMIATTTTEKITSTTIILLPTAEGRVKLIRDLTNEGFTAAYNDYRFKIDDFLYLEGGKISGIILDVQKPDGTVVMIQMTDDEYGYVDDLQIKFAPDYAKDISGKQTAAIYVVEMLE